MVKKILKYLLYISVFTLALIYFIPKNSLYYFMEQELQKYDVIISHEKLKDDFLYLKISNMVIDVQGVQSVTIDNSEIMLLLFYNNIHLDDITLSSAMKAFLPVKIKKASVIYTILDPLHVRSQIQGDFGKAQAVYSVNEKKLRVILYPSQRMLQQYKNSLNLFQKVKNGEYIYAKTF